jgi:hypothetical protein
MMVTREQLEAVAIEEVNPAGTAFDQSKSPPARERGVRTALTATGSSPAPRPATADRTEWIARAEKYIDKMKPSIAGQRGHDALYAVACVLVDGFGLTKDEAAPLFAQWNRSHADPPESDAQLEHKLDDAIRNHPVPSRSMQSCAARLPDRPPSESGGVEFVCLADVDPKPLQWLWADRLPLGAISIIAGDPGLGKSFITLDIAARVSRGAEFPDGHPCASGTVLLFNAEDDLEVTIVPRLIAVGADLRRVHTTRMTKADGKSANQFTLEDLESLEQALAVHTDTTLVVLDPVSAFMGKTDDHRNSEVRGLLAPLAALAARHSVAILLVTHMNKSDNIKTLNKVMGSLAYTACARAVWAVMKDPENPKEDRLLVPVKCNLAPQPTGLRFSISPDQQVVWDPEPVDLSADDALEGEPSAASEKQIDKAAEFLRRIIGTEPVPAKQVYEAGKAEGLSERTIDRAKKREGIESVQTGAHVWLWRYPEGDPDLPPGCRFNISGTRLR